MVQYESVCPSCGGAEENDSGKGYTNEARATCQETNRIMTETLRKGDPLGK